MDAALPPGPREPAALQTLEWVARPTAFLRRCAAAYGEAFTIRLAFDDAPLVLVWHPEAVRAVYAADPSVARRGASPGPLRPVAGPRSILFADGAEHLRIRRLMLASFHGERIAAYRAVTRDVALEHVARWPRGRPVQALGLMQELTLDVILRAVFGTSDERLAADIRDTLGVARSLPRAAAMSLAQRDLGPRSPWGAFLRRMAVVDEQLMALIARRRAEGAGGDDVLAQLLAAGLDDAELRDHLVTLLAAGHETTAGSLAWALERLARAPESSRTSAPATRRGSTPWSRRPCASARCSPSPRASSPRRCASTASSCRPGCTWRRASTSSTAARTSTPTRARGGRSAGWAPPRRSPSPGSRSAVACAAAWARPSRRWRWPRCCALVAERLDVAPADARGERMRRRGITLQPGRGARVVLSDASSWASSS